MSLLNALANATMPEDEADGRIYGWLAGTVTDAEAVDGKKTCRVKARVGKQGDNESTDWLVPLLPGGVESVPNNGDKVAVFFMDGDPNRGAYVYLPDSRTQNRPTDWMVLGSVFASMYNDLATKFNTLLACYQAFYGFVQGHTHASFGTPSVSLLEATIVTAHDFDSATGKMQNANGSTVGASSLDAKALSGRARVGI